MLQVLAAASVSADDLFLPLEPSDVPPGIRAVDAASATAGVEHLGPTLRLRYARLDPDVIERARAAAARDAAPASLVDLNLFDDVTLRVTGLRTARTLSGFSLSGQLDGEPPGTMTLVVNGDVVAGEARARGAAWTIRSAGDLVEIREAEEEALPECGGVLAPPPASPAVAATASDLPVADLQPSSSGAVIDLLVVYTTASKDYLGGEAATETQIDLWVTATNGYFEASGVDHRIRLVHVEEMAGYVETELASDLLLLRRPDDGVMDSVHAMRDAVGADLVHLVERWGAYGTISGYCGLAYVMRKADASFAPRAFGVTVDTCGSRTFAHELGHNLGLRHARYEEDANLRNGKSGLGAALHAHAHGYVNQKAFAAGADASTRWRTIMAYNSQCSDAGFNCPTIDRFSNPARTWLDDPLGVWSNGDANAVTGPADAASTLNATGPVAAAFRSAAAAPRVVSLRRRQPVDRRTNSDSLLWRLAFSQDVKNVASDDFELAGSGLGTTTLTVTAKTGSQRIWDIAVTAGIDSFDGDVTLGFAAGHDIASLSGVAMDAAWPDHAERSYTLDNVAPTPSISPSSAGGSPFVATIEFAEDVTGFGDAADVAATNATVYTPARTDASTYTVSVNPAGSVAGTIGLSVPAAAATDLAGNGSAAASRDVNWDPSTASSLTVSGFSDASVAENVSWTSATPTVGGSPSGTVSWVKPGGGDSELFTIDSSTGVLGLPGQDYEDPADTLSDNVYSVRAMAVDAKGNSAEASVAVTVTDAEEFPRIAGGSVRNLFAFQVLLAHSKKIVDGSSYSSKPWLTCGEACAPIEGAVGDVTWRVTGPDAFLFTLNSGTLSLSARDFDAPADADRDNDYMVTVTGTDADGNTNSEAVIVRVVKGVPGWLEVSGPSPASTEENRAWSSGAPSVAGAVGAVGWTAEGPDAARFSVDSGSGVLTLAAQDYEAPADADKDRTYEALLRATDGDGNSGTAPVAVSVKDVTESTPGPGPGPGGGGGGPGPPPDDEGDGDDGGGGGPSGGGAPPRAAISVDVPCVEDLCRARTGVPVLFEDTSSGAVRFRTWNFGDGTVSRNRTRAHSWSEAGFYETTLRVSDGTTESTASLTFLVEAADPAGDCEADAETLCLRDSRYRVRVSWRTASGESGPGVVVRAGTNDSGLFRFFGPDNWEALIKVLDGCALNGHVWVFGASTTDLGYRIEIADTATGVTREYENEPGRAAPAITDLRAFAGDC